MTTVQIDIELLTDSFKSALNQATNQTKSFSTQASKSFDTVNSSFSVMAGSLAAQAVSQVFSGITNSIGLMINEAAQAEQAVQQLNIALKNAGLFSDASSKDLQNYADSIERITIYSGEAVLSSLSLLSTLTTLDTQGIKKATQASVDLAASLGIDLETATQMISKSINGNTTAFSKLGFEIQKGNSDAERLTNTLKALESQQGSAEKSANTYSGSIAKLNNQKSQLMEALGRLVTENPNVIQGINNLSEVFSSLATYVDENKSVLTNFNSIFTNFLTSLNPAIGGLYAMVTNWNELKTSIYNTIAATLEYSALAVGLISEERAASIRNEATAYRDKANAIRETAKVEVENNTISDEQTKARLVKLKQEQDETNRNAQFKTETQRIQNQNLLLIDEELNLQKQELATTHESNMAQIKNEFDTAALTKQYEQQSAQLTARQEYETELLNAQLSSDMAKAQAEQDAQARSLAVKAASDKANIERAKLSSKQEIEQIKLKQKADEDISKTMVANRKETLSTISSLSQSSNKELAMIGKAAALTQIAIDTPVAIGKAMSSAPPPFNFVLAAAVGAAMADQAARVAGVKFADGGIVQGTSMTGDRVRASLNSGEMVLNRGQQAKLFAMANDGTTKNNNISNQETNALLAGILQAVKSGQSINIDGREIVNVVRSAKDSGYTF